MYMRELKALEIAARAKIVFERGVWHVPSQSGTKKYRVMLEPTFSCECEDFQLRLGGLPPECAQQDTQKACKHILAVKLVIERDHNGKNPEFIVDAVPNARRTRRIGPPTTNANHGEASPASVAPRSLQRHRRTTLRNQGPSARATGGQTLRRRLQGLFDVQQPPLRVRPCRRARGRLPLDAHAPQQDQCLLGTRGTDAVSVFAVDSSGFSTCKFVRWFDEKYGQERSGRTWVKVHLAVGCKTNVVTAAAIYGPDAADCPVLPELTKTTTASGFTIKEMTADKAYLSVENVEAIHAAGAAPFIAPKENTTAPSAVYSSGCSSITSTGARTS